MDLNAPASSKTDWYAVAAFIAAPSAKGPVMVGHRDLARAPIMRMHCAIAKGFGKSVTIADVIAECDFLDLPAVGAAQDVAVAA